MMRLKTLPIIIAVLMAVSGCSIGSETGNLTVATLEKPIARTAVVRAASQNFWEAMHHFDFDYVNRQPVGETYRQFAQGLQLVMAGEQASAETLFTTLFESTSDSLIRQNAAEILQSIYNNQDKWGELVDLSARLPHGLDEDNTVFMAKAFTQALPESYHFPDQPVTLATKLSISGVPMVEVKVNGVAKRFWIDTGAEMTVLSSAFAAECGVTPIGTDAARIGTSTDIKISMRPGVIREFRIGGLLIENHPVIILDKKDLEVRLFKIFRLLKIDGIIGWNVLRNLDLTLDYKSLTTTIRPPVRRQSAERNFHFLSQPLVSLTDTLGAPFYFFLDVGANRTTLYEPALQKIDTSRAVSKNALVGGAGGTQHVKTREIPQVALVLGDHRLNFANLSLHGDGKEGFFYFDGVLGSDIAERGTLILDFQNGRCELKMPE